MTVPPWVGRPFLVDSLLTQPPAHRELLDDRGDVAHDHIVGVRVLGELDHSTAPMFTAELACAGRRGLAVSSWAASPALQLDLSGLTFLDTGGLSALVETRQHLVAIGCRLCLTHPRPGVLRLLDLAVFSAWLPADVECADGHPWPAVAQPIRPKTRHGSGRAWPGIVPLSPPPSPGLSDWTPAPADLHPEAVWHPNTAA